MLTWRFCEDLEVVVAPSAAGITLAIDLNSGVPDAGYQ